MVVGVIATLLAVVLNAMGAVMGAPPRHDGQRAYAALLARTSLSRRGMALEHRCRLALAIGSALWNSAPGVSIGVVFTMLVLTQACQYSS
ncbi:hypothetical protein GS872_00885 [Rhodococcus hoagii]|nr:hypothetical protein [Prescottella equi]